MEIVSNTSGNNKVNDLVAKRNKKNKIWRDNARGGQIIYAHNKRNNFIHKKNNNASCKSQKFNTLKNKA